MSEWAPVLGFFLTRLHFTITRVYYLYYMYYKQTATGPQHNVGLGFEVCNRVIGCYPLEVNFQILASNVKLH